MLYEYKMVQVPPTILVTAEAGNEAAQYLEKIVGEMSEKGWEFHRIDEIGVRTEPGCLLSLLGQKASHSVYYVISFRKERRVPTAPSR